ncbi:hypothetical protein [Shewanella sp. Isolate11]|uniref:hypothetical protein n=1 Tax=Shewanella sp. Isolate11 TaxID=2908530 RepID=UPI001EFC8CC7|nr:hypothetical protein [Shewanella sp. Isolate11]MCG9696799.1 hypothetical protein [Shewanella sp. Isolate11]
MSADFPLIDIPFEQRHTCWFCAEPCADTFEYPAQAYTPHPSLAVPSCKECKKIASKNPLTSIWDCHMAVKDELMRIYAKHLAIGENWTEQELAESEFSCKVFEGFKKSAWFMYQVAKGRVSAAPWPISINGVALDSTDYQLGFQFDGVNYSSIAKAVDHYSQMLGLDKDFLQQLVSIVGRHRFAYAVRVSRLNIVASKAVKRQVLQDIANESTDDIS